MEGSIGALIAGPQADRAIEGERIRPQVSLPNLAAIDGDAHLAVRHLHEQAVGAALQIIDAVSQGRVLFIATGNSITSLPPELRRCFMLGTFFFDLPTAEERETIWEIYFKKYGVSGDLPNDEGWTGAEIKECCRQAHRLGITLAGLTLHRAGFTLRG
ncbi:MAG: hypothetical protein ABSF46_01515 [Terriglobia bacterium]|jgi:SpoVK/Ycf46/Vps4 family AAA+-type ATPase